MKFTYFGILVLSFVTIADLPAQNDRSIDFATQVKPILSRHCASCHNDEDRESEFSVDSVKSILEGSVAGPAIKPGDPDSSHIIGLMRGTEEPIMPPEDDFERVTESEIAIVERWIKEGAKDSVSSKKLTIKVPAWNTKIKVKPPILAADWSVDGNLIAVAQYGNVKLLDAIDLKPVFLFDELPGKVNSVSFSNDGKQLIAASGISGVGGRAYLWDVASRKQIATFEGHSDVMYDAALSPDGRYAATCAYDKSILLWNVADGKQIRTLKGHNSAVYDLDFSADSKNLISASNDQTIKVWNVETGQRLDTLGQPLKEQFVCTFSPDGQTIVGGGRDNRLRIWQRASIDSIAINPLLFSRFAHEGSIVRLNFSADGDLLFSSSEDLTIRVWETEGFQQVGLIEGQTEVCSAMAVSPDAKRIFLGRLDGSFDVVDVPAEKRAVRSAESVNAIEQHRDQTVAPGAIAETETNNDAESAQKVQIPSVISGAIDQPGDYDLFRFKATAGQSFMVETRAAQDGSPVDTKIEILHDDGSAVPQVVLRAIRDSYFTFRGKNSDTIDDYRVHNWQEMKLNQYLYAGGEVNRLFLHPRGPDSGFRVYPGVGKKRFAYFATTPVSHALQEPCYIVEAWPPGTSFVPNGLPVFELNYENDDDSRREIGSDSRIKFVAPVDGDYIARVSDVRGFGGEDFKYQLTVRESNPDFGIRIGGNKKIFSGSGTELRLNADRKDGFEGSIRIDIENTPPGYHIVSPVVIEAQQIQAATTIYALEGAKSITAEQAKSVAFRASTVIAGKEIKKTFHGLGELKLESEEPKIELVVTQSDSEEVDLFSKATDFKTPTVLEVRPGETVEAIVIAKRNRHDGRISFGKAAAGRNLPQGVYVSDIGLNGLMITAGSVKQRFFIKADEFVQPQSRLFHLRAEDVDKIASPPVMLKVLPPRKGD